MNSNENRRFEIDSLEAYEAAGRIRYQIEHDQFGLSETVEVNHADICLILKWMQQQAVAEMTRLDQEMGLYDEKSK